MSRENNRKAVVNQLKKHVHLIKDKAIKEDIEQKIAN